MEKIIKGFNYTQKRLKKDKLFYSDNKTWNQQSKETWRENRQRKWEREIIALQETMYNAKTRYLKSSHSFDIWSGCCTHRYSPNSYENLCPYKKLQAILYSSSIHNHSKLNTVKMMFFNRQVDKLQSLHK